MVWKLAPHFSLTAPTLPCSLCQLFEPELFWQMFEEQPQTRTPEDEVPDPRCQIPGLNALVSSATSATPPVGASFSLPRWAEPTSGYEPGEHLSHFTFRISHS